MRFAKQRIAGFSLVEMMISVAIIGIAGFGVFEILRTGMILYGKNSATNVSNIQGRFGLYNLEQDLHSAASTPELTDSAGTILSSGTATGPAAGVYFQAYGGGPFQLYVGSSGSLTASSTSVQIVTGTVSTTADYKPMVGQTLHIQYLPTALVEGVVSSVSSASWSSSETVYTLGLSSSLGQTIMTAYPSATGTGTTAMSVACFLTSPVKYLVQPASSNYQLVNVTLTTGDNSITNVLARGITSAQPFSTGSAGGSVNTNFIQTTNFTAVDLSSNNRGYQSVTTPFTIEVPHYAQLTTKY